MMEARVDISIGVLPVYQHRALTIRAPFSRSSIDTETLTRLRMADSPMASVGYGSQNQTLSSINLFIVAVNHPTFNITSTTITRTTIDFTIFRNQPFNHEIVYPFLHSATGIPPNSSRSGTMCFDNWKLHRRSRSIWW